MTTTPHEPPTVQVLPGTGPNESSPRDERWLRAARQAKRLAWASLLWMTVEGIVGVVAGLQAHSVGVLTWAASSAVEGLASVIVVWRFTGKRTHSETSEARAQKWVAASFFLLAPYFLFEAVHKLVVGSDTEATTLAIALTASSLVLMPLLGWAKLRLGKQLGSGATAGEGTQNLLCAAQAGFALVGLVGAGVGVGFLDPLAAFVIAGIAMKEGLDGWRGEDCACHTVPGLEPQQAPVAAPACDDDCCA